MTSRLYFEIEGKIKPCVRTTRGSLWNEQSREYAKSKTDMQIQFTNQMANNKWEMWPSPKPLAMEIRYCVPSRLHGHDIDNVIKAICDAAQGTVFKDDRYIDIIKAERWQGDDHLAQILIMGAI